jgi:hypothetical protein
MRIATEDLLKEYQIGHLFPDFPPDFTPPWLLDPNYVAPSMQPVMYAIIGITTFLMSITVIARLIVRSPLKKSSWGFDDWLIIPAWLLTLGMVACEIFTINVGGVGHHSYDLSWAELVVDYRMAFIIFMFYIWSTLFTKLSIIAFYYRLAGPMDSRTYRILGPLVVWCISLTVTSMFLNIFGFSPVQAGWDLNLKLHKFTALPANRLWVALSALYTVTDVFILVIPLPMLWKLRMRTGKKIKLCFLFSLGAIACIAIAVRTIYLHRVYDSFDPTCRRFLILIFYANKKIDGGYIITIADQLETTIAIIAASIPALGALLMAVWDGGLVALLTWWQSANSYLGLTGESRSYPTVSSGTELKLKKKSTKQMADDSTDSDTKALSLPLQQNSTTKTNDSKSTLWKSWGHRNILNFTTRDDSQMQSTMNNTVDEEDGLPLHTGERMGMHTAGNNTATNGTFPMDQSFDLVIQHPRPYHNSWDEVEKRYSQRH